MATGHTQGLMPFRLQQRLFVQMHSKCGSIENAKWVFDGTDEVNLFGRSH